MTKKEQKRRKAITKRSNKAIDKLNEPKKRYITDFEKVREFLEKEELPYEQGTNDGIRPYLFINFDDSGDAIDPC